MKAKPGISFLFPLLAFGARAATFSVTPNVVSNDYTGLITFQMTGLSPGETVQLVQYYDFNGNGVLDAADLAVRGETVSDGESKLTAGVTNVNVFRDEDGATNGAITAAYWFPLAPPACSTVSSYIFRISSPSSHFAATNIPFTVVSLPYAQEVHGAVVNNFTNIPHALVALLHAAAPGAIPTVIVSATADVSGNYTLKAPPGIYQAAAFQTGYAGNLQTFPPVNLAPNATVTTDIPLVAATTSISGSLVDSTNAGMHAVPFAEVEASTANGDVVLGFCDSDAKFNLPVTPGVWVVGALWQSAGAQSYMLEDVTMSTPYDTSSGPVSDAVVPLKHSTSLINGRVVDSLGNPVPGVGLFANADFGQYNASAASVDNGFYSLAIDAGFGTVNVQNTSEAPANNYIWPTPQFFINSGQVLSLNVTGLVATARFRSHVLDDTGAPLRSLRAAADSLQIYGAYTFATTDPTGYLDMPVFGGTWSLIFLGSLPGLVFPDIPVFAITNGLNRTNDIVARTVTGTVSGYVHDTAGHGITNLTVAVTNHLGSTNFTLKATTDANGNYSVAVFDGTWNVSPDKNTLGNHGYIPVAPTNVTLPPAGAVANFIVSSVPPPQILTTNLPDATIGGYYSATLVVTNGANNILWSLTSGALPDGLALNMFGFISGFPTNLGLFNFTLKAQDSRGSNDVKSLSIRVRPLPTGPPKILTTSLADAVVGCPYTGHLQATNGTPPYSWALAASSGSMPPGLNLATDGAIYGTPSSNNSFTVTVQLSGADGATTNNVVTFQVNSSLQVYPSPLPAGSVGTPYYGYPSVYGGAQPQAWSIISNSLPPNLALNATNGQINGTPASVGAYDFTLRVTDGCATIDIATSITNYPALQIITPSLPAAPLNIPYSAQLQAAGGLPPYAWYNYTPLPYGLTLNVNGSITGTPYFEGENGVNFVVYDSIGGSATRILTLIATSKPVLDLPAVSAPNQFTLRVTGVSGRGYTLQAALDLTNWADLFTTNAPANVFYLTDTNATGPYRYYRLKENQ